MNDAKTKSQIVEKITGSTNILVTVSNDPSVDALSAAIGLTLILNKLSKHTTAIFSGQAPPAITFLDPQKTFETSIDSLRDFIIALDKEKADHLRYKVEGDVVKIFITPYKTTISSDDLEFSQGDYNVELVLALGVENQAHLDTALEAHGSILHDATVITISTGQGSSSLGSIDWRDETASSLSEMMVGLTESLKSDTPLIDQPIATALLTGIVAETDRFSNPKTSAKVMTMAAQLMAAGADQQLIASKLQESHEIGNNVVPVASAAQPVDQTAPPVKEGLAIAHDVVPPVDTATTATSNDSTLTTSLPTPPSEPIGSTTIDTYSDTPTQSTDPITVGKVSDAYALDPEPAVDTTPSTPAIAPLLGGVAPTTTESTPPIVTPVSTPSAEPTAPLVDSSVPPPAEPSHDLIGSVAPSAQSPTPVSEEISHHSYLGESSTYDTPVNGPATPGVPPVSVDIFATPPSAPEPATGSTEPAATDPSSVSQSGGGRDEASRDDALAAVSAAYSNNPPVAPPASFSPAPGINLPPPPPLPDFGALPTPSPDSAYALDPLPQQPSERLGDILAPSPPPSNDPGQFKIPGQ